MLDIDGNNYMVKCSFFPDGTETYEEEMKRTEERDKRVAEFLRRKGEKEVKGKRYIITDIDGEIINKVVFTETYILQERE